MKNKVIVKRNEHDIDNWLIDFYFVTGKQTIYLFSQNYTQGVYDYFRNGRSENELYKFKGWKTNPTLGKIIKKIPLYKKYILKEIA